MKLLHVIPGVSPGQGGLQTALLNLCRAQAAVGIQPEVAALREAAPPDAAFSEFNVRLFRCDFAATGASRELRRWLEAHAADYDAVVAHSLWRAPLWYTAGLERLYVVAHGMLDPEALAHRAWRKWWARHFRVPAVLRGATVVFTCRAEQERAAVESPGVVIPLPVTVPDTPPLPSPGGPIVALGRVHPRKGLLEWVRALATLDAQGVQFTAEHAGPDEDADYARQVRAEAAPMIDSGRLKFHGALDYAQAQALLARASVVCAPCNVPENFGMVIAEGMAQGRPVVAGRRGLMVPELEQAGALLGTDLSPEDFANAIRQAVSDGADMAQRGHGWAAEHFRPEVVGQAWRAMIELTAR